MATARRTILGLALLASAALPAYADNWELVARRGENDRDYDSAGIALRLGPGWSRPGPGGLLSLRPELEVNHFRYGGPASGPRQMNQAGINGLMRFQFGERTLRPYAELALGLSAFSDSALGSKGFSTRYQFSEHIGAGLEVADRWLIGWRYSHYSNASIRKPNDGMDLHQLVLGVRF